MNEQLPLSQPLGLGDLLDRAFRLFRARFWQLLGTAAVLLVPAAILGGLFNAIVGEVTMAATIAGDEPSLAEFGALGLAGLLFYLLTFVATAVAELALTYRAGAALYERDFSLGESIRRGFGRLLSYIGMRLVQGIAMAVLAVPLLCILGLVFGGTIGVLGAFLDTAGSTGDGAAGIGAVLLGVLIVISGVLLVALPFLYLYARWVVAVQCLVFEDMGPVDALRRSWKLTQGQSLRVLAYTILLALLIFLVTGLPMLLVNQVLIALLPPSPGLAQGVAAAVQALVNVIWQPIYVAALVLLYYDLRVRRESPDLAAQIGQLERDVRRAGV